MTGISAIFFDAGNTLLYPYPSVGATMARVCQSHGIEKTAQDFDEHMVSFADYYAQAYENDESFWSEHDRQQRMWIDGYSLILRRAGIESDIEQLVNDIYNAFDDAQAWRLFEGVESTFAELKERGYRIGIISNWGRGLNELLEGLGLGAYIDSVTASAGVGMHKPEPDIFRHALSSLSVSADNALHVGDHPIADVAGCRAVGMHPVLIEHSSHTMLDPTAQRETSGVPRIASIPEILSLLSR
ncbi:MAG: HAD-IA family hydrolase [Coriobacteriia bacterium]|nr:HAD-IA family hydrolase [Coriobacteriia bacterium]